MSKRLQSLARPSAIRGKPALAPLVLAALGACASPPASRAPEETAALRSAAAALARGDLEQAQSEYARARTESPDRAAAWLGFGETSFRLFLASVADPKRGNALLYLQDAEQAFHRAVELDPKDLAGCLGSSRVAREKGEGAEAAKWAQRAKDRIEHGTPNELRYDVLMELGRARALEFALASRAHASPVLQGEIYQRTRDAYFSARALRPESLEPILEWAGVEAERGAVEDAMDALATAILERTEEVPYHQALCNIALAGGAIGKLVETYEVRLAKLQDSSPTVLWYSGYAKSREAEAARMKRDYASADRDYETALELFERSAAKNPTFAKSAAAARALATAGEARSLLERKRVAEAAARLSAAFAIDASILEQADGLGITAKRTSLEIGGEFFQASELEEGARCFEGWLAYAPDDVDWLNNAGLLRRDLGEALTRDGNQEKAKASFEASYQHYKRVADLRPDEPRLVNDAALLLLYHLDRDLDVAEEMFRRAIRLGEERLEELGDRPDPEEGDAAGAAAADRWDYFAEAAGDAYQNLALLLWKRGGDAAEIRRLFARSFELDPRGTRGHFKTDVAALPVSGPAPKLDRQLR